MEAERPGYYAIIPADVRYDDRIPANAKLLYGEISALINKDGYCFAANAYFCQLYQLSDASITRLIGDLVKHGYLIRELVRDNAGQIVQRKLYLKTSVPDIQPPIKNKGTSPQKKGEGTLKNEGYTNTSISNIPPLIPPEGEAAQGKRKSRSKEYKAQAEYLPERFDGFWLFYRTHIPNDRSAGNRQAAIRAWDKLKPSDDLASTMAHSLSKQVRSQAWSAGVGVPHASTWLNNHGWEDDWGGAPDQSAGMQEEAGEWL